jgi:hypothetical protein
MIGRWIKDVTAACRLGFAAGACAGAPIASSLLRSNQTQTGVMSVLVLCTLFAVIHGSVGALVGAVIGVVGRLIARAVRRNDRATPGALDVVRRRTVSW